MIKTACIIDDDAIYLFAMRRIIKNLGLCEDLMEFSDAQLAIDYFSGAPEKLPELILVDINMPVLDGWDFLHEYGALERNWAVQPKLYMVSSSVDDADLVKANAEPLLTGYLTKPLNEQILRSIFSI